MKKFKAFISILVLLVTLLTMTSPALGDTSSTIVISTAEELIDFAEKASFDKWSRNKNVILVSDIDLKNKEFEPIPIFSGNFDGQNHTIKGLLINKEGSNFGLFRYLEKEGVIKNLKVEGALIPKGDRSNIGGIVGYNKGRIENTSFFGHVKGKDAVGGIVGLNGISGSLVDSQVKGVIYGETKVGGIAGFNTGTITNTKNYSSVNTTVEEATIQIEDINIDIINIGKLTTDSMDIGGIVGLSSGIVSQSENTGTIGYKSHGYNIGGIVGRQSGHISDCSNFGKVYGRKDIGGIVGQMEPYIDRVIPPSKIRALQNELGPFRRNMNQILSSLKVTSGKINSSMTIINQELEKIEPYMKTLIDKIEKLIPGRGVEGIEDIEKLLPDLTIDDLEELFPSEEPIFDEEYEEAREGLFSSMGIIFKEFSLLVNDLGKETDSLIGAMEGLSNNIFRMMDLMFGIIDEISSMTFETGKVYEDVSDKDVDKYKEGRVTNSINSGHIRGDINIGGVAGAMGIEFEFDPEEDLKLQNKLNYDTVYQSRLAITYCKNRGNIISKKNNAGGIVGNQEMGYIKACQSENLIQSTDGNYVGGIAGISKGPIVNSFVKVELEGGSYIGGIGGYARDIQNSYSMVKITNSRAYIGAIAGDIENSGNISSNFYISDNLKGIDGISYEGKAEYISYNDLMSIKDLPEIFKSFRLDFFLEEKLIKSISFQYGDSIQREVFPKVADRDESYAKWEVEELENLIFDTKVRAKYLPYTSLLESEAKRKELAIILVEGKFREEDSIRLEEEIKFSLGKNKAIESWNIYIPEDGEVSHTIRYNPPKQNKNYGIYVFTNNNWNKIRVKEDGKYLVFSADGDYVNIGIFEERPGILKYLLIFMLVFLPFILVKLYKNKRRKLAAEE